MRHAQRLSHTLFVIFALVFFTFVVEGSYAQTPGLIFKPAVNGGNKVLDPNGDGYVSKQATGFVGTNDERGTYSEIPYHPFPTMTNEVVGDLVTGTSGGHTDFVPSQSIGATGSPLAAYFDGTNLMFRVRIGKQSTASKGYSIMIDTDEKFGNLVSGSTPSNTPNPGFEFEVVLASNFDVSLYDHRNKPDGGTKIWTGSIDQYFQKSIAASRASGDDDYFYDFYLPLSAFAGTVNLNTKLRMTGITITSAQSGITGTVSDVGGVNFSGAYGGEARNAWADVINSFPAVTLNELMNGGFPSNTIMARPPVISSTIFTSSTSISGTSVEAVGSVIQLFQNGAPICGAGLSCPTVTASGTWSLNNIPFGTLIGGAEITARVTAPGKPQSVASVGVSVIQLASFCTATVPPVITGVSTGNPKTLTGTTQYPGQQVIKVFKNGAMTPDYSETVTATGTAAPYSFELTTALTEGMWSITTTPAGQCESFKSNEMCYNGKGNGSFNTTTVTLNSVTYSDGTSSTGPAIKNSITSISGTVSKTGDIVYIFKNGERQSAYSVVPATTSWQINVSSLAFSTGDVITARSIQSGVSNGSYTCGDVASNRSNFLTITAVTSKPTISGSYCTTGSISSVTGACKEPAGTSIQLYNASNNSPIGSPTTVNASGSWTVTATIASGTSFYAIATASGKSPSQPSSTVTLRSPDSNTGLAITSVPVIEGTTTLSGTAPAGSNKIITLYIGGSPYGSVTTSTGNWTFTNISPLELYSGADLYVTVKTATTCESAPSPVVYVQCKAPATGFTVSSSIVSPDKVCYEGNVTLNLSGSENGVIYNMYVFRNGVYTRTGSSVLGTGKPISLLSGPLTIDPTTLQVKATKVGSVNCEPNVGNASTVGVYPQVPNTYDVTASTTSGCPGLTTSITVKAAATGYSYQLYNITTKSLLGTPITPTAAGDIVFPAITVHSTADYSVYIKSTETQCGTENINSKYITVTITGPTVTQAVTQSASKVCVGGTVSFSFDGQSGYTYSLIDKDTGGQVGSSVNGSTGTKVTFNAGPLNTAGIKNYRIRVTGGACNTFLVTEPSVEVTTGGPSTVSAGPDATTCVKNYTLQGSDPAPGTGTWTQVSGPAGATIVNPNNAKTNVIGLTSGTYQFRWTVVSNCGTATSTSSTVTLTVNCEAVYSVKTTKFVDEYVNGEVLATVADEDGGIKSASLQSGILPRGTTLNNATGEIRITDATQLQSGNYVFTVRTIDAYDKQTNSVVGIRMYDRQTPPEILPFAVELASFTASYTNHTVILNWVTASEENNDRFEVERSINGKDFLKIGTVKGNGTTNQLMRYTFTDKHFATGTFYYRLKQVDFDGKYTYSKIVAVSADKSLKASAQAYPNPFSTELNISVALETEGQLQVQLLDVQGTTVLLKSMTFEQGTHEVKLPLSNLKQGVYLLRLNGGGLNQTLKVVKTL